MKVSEFIVKEIEEMGTTDAFGIPGGVVLPFLYAIKESNIEPHLTYHEQTAGFAACGYAQASGKIGLAYATRGPGISNMFTAIAEAYQESIPVVFITSHGKRDAIEGQRFGSNQELDIVASVQNITKYAVNIDEIDQVITCVTNALKAATSGRKGPTLIDVAATLWDKELDYCLPDQESEQPYGNYGAIFKEIGSAIFEATRPVILIGDGLRYAAEKDELLSLSEKLRVPVISSRGSQDLLSGSHYYFGYVGSHGIRYSNFIMSKADLIIAIGNRMAFPRNSSSFSPVIRNARIIRIDVDEGELKNEISSEITYQFDVGCLIKGLSEIERFPEAKEDWITLCNQLKQELNQEDCTDPVMKIAEYLLNEGAKTYVCDVGNNEFWFSRAYEKVQCTARLLISKSFGTLGSAIGKAIGAYYATGEKVVCVVGDQGFQYNIQELQYIVSNQIPVKALLINNMCSRMIEDHEMTKYDGKVIHVNKKSGYQVPDFMRIVKAYGAEDNFSEIVVDENIALSPNLPRDNACQDLHPALDREKYYHLNEL